MLIQPVDYVLVVWFILACASALYVGIDQYRNNPEPVVMKWGFILVTLYTGPIGLLLYVLADKEPRPGEHEAFIKPLWKQGVGSTIHCIAGDATGIILAAAVTALIGLPMWDRGAAAAADPVARPRRRASARGHRRGTRGRPRLSIRRTRSRGAARRRDRRRGCRPGLGACMSPQYRNRRGRQRREQ